MKALNGLAMLEVAANIMGRIDVIHPVLIWDAQIVILVDAGFPGQMAKIREEIEKAGVNFDNLNKIIITHQDLDHIGSLPEILAQAEDKIEVLASELEIPYIQGEKQLIKITPEAIELAMKSITSEAPEEWRKTFKHVLENPPHAMVDTIVSDGQDLPYCGGITIIETPGHTPGHVSLYHKDSKTLITGDAMRVVDGQLWGPNPQATLDMELAMSSLARLTQYDIETVICYHGGIYTDNPKQRITELTFNEHICRL